MRRSRGYALIKIGSWNGVMMILHVTIDNDILSNNISSCLVLITNDTQTE